MATDLAAAVRDSDRRMSLRQTGLLDSAPEAAFDRLSRFAAIILQAPIALIVLVDADRHFFKSAYGLPDAWAAQRGPPLSHSFWQHQVTSGKPLVVSDARTNPLGRENVTIREMGAIAYAGIPLITGEEHVLGSFCVMDTKPREWRQEEIELLQDLTASVMTEIELRRTIRERTPREQGQPEFVPRAQEAQHQVTHMVEQITDAFIALDQDWRFTYLNARAEHLLKHSRDELRGRNIWQAFPEAVGTTFYHRYQEAVATEEPIAFEEYFAPLTAWFAVKAYPSPDGLSILFTDISQRKRVEEAQHFLSEVTSVLASSLDYATTLRSVAQLAVPHLADWCTVHIVDEAGADHRVATAHRDPAKVALAREMWERYPWRPEAVHGIPQVLRSGQPELVPEIPDDLLAAVALDAEHLRILRTLGLRSYMIVPIIARQHVLGVITFATAESGRHFGPDNLALAEELAQRAAVAVDNARLYAAEQQARSAAEQTAHRMARLQAVTAALADALTADEVGRIVLDQGLAALSANAGAVALVTDDARELEVTSALGYPQALLEAWRRFPRDAPAPLADVVRTQRAIWLDSPAALAIHYPHLAVGATERERSAWAAIPLIVDGRAIGAMGFSFAEPRLFTRTDKEFVEALAHQCALALERARLFNVAKTELAERTRAEAALRASEEQFRSLSACSPVGIFVTDISGSCTYTNPRCQAICGFTFAESLREGWAGHVHPDDRGRVVEAWLACARRGGEFSDEVRFQGPDGSVCWTHVRSAPMFSDTGQLIGHVGTVEDITTRKQAEAELTARVRQQAAVADLGQRALAGLELGTLMDDIVTVVAQILDVEYCKVQELVAAGDALLLRAGVGWQAGLVGHATVGIGADSQAGYTLQSATPIIVEDLRTETRFSGPPLLHNHRVTSGMSVIIQGQNQPFGVLGAHTTRRRVFTDDDAHFLQAVANVLAQAIERKHAEDAIRQYADRLRILHELDQAILAPQDARAIGQAAVHHVRQLIPCRRASVTLFDFDTETISVLAADVNGAPAALPNARLPGATRDVPDVLRQGKLHCIEDLQAVVHPSPTLQSLQRDGVRGYLNVPLVTQGKVIGSLNLGIDRPGPFVPEHVEIARELADSLAVAIQHAQLFDAVRTGHERLQLLSRRLMEVQERERRSLARELHDEVGQQLTALKLLLAMIGRLSGDACRPRVDEAQVLVHELMRLVRALSLDLRPAMLDDLGLLPALLWQFERYTALAGVQVHFTHHRLNRRFRPEVETAAYRIVQEALTNVARYAGVQEVAVSVWLDDKVLGVQITDHGAGFDRHRIHGSNHSNGLSSMQERATLLGGRLTVISAPKQGTMVQAELPVNDGDTTHD